MSEKVQLIGTIFSIFLDIALLYCPRAGIGFLEDMTTPKQLFRKKISSSARPTLDKLTSPCSLGELETVGTHCTNYTTSTPMTKINAVPPTVKRDSTLYARIFRFMP